MPQTPLPTEGSIQTPTSVIAAPGEPGLHSIAAAHRLVRISYGSTIAYRAVMKLDAIAGGTIGLGYVFQAVAPPVGAWVSTRSTIRDRHEADGAVRKA